MHSVFGVCFYKSTVGESIAQNFYKEAVIIGGYSDKDQWVGKKDMMLKNSIGFEYFRKFSDEYGDFLTLDIQMRIAYDSMENSSDTFGVEIHNAWLEYKLGLGTGYGKFTGDTECFQAVQSRG